MKKIFLIFLMVILISTNISSLSLFGAQDISRKYLSENDMIDTFTQPKIVCDKKDYFVIPIINPLGEPVLFIPISIESSDLFLSKTDSFNVKLIKTGYLVKQLRNSDSSNYLSPQLIDRINSLITSLNSKKAQLNGLLQKNYSFPVREQLTKTINKIDVLIVYLTDLKENSSNLLNSQNSFLSSPNCDSTASLLSTFDTSFEGYKELSQITLDYIQSTEALVTRLVADETIAAQEISGIISIVSPPQNLNSQVNYIFESFSSTSAFYSKQSNDLKGVNGDRKIKIYIDNLSLRKESVDLKNLLEKYDPSFPNYSNLDSVVKTILDQQYRTSWVEQAEVENVFKTYNEINELTKNARYSDAITKVSSLKKSALKVLESGLMEEEENEISSTFYYIFVGVIILMLIVFLIIIKKKSKDRPSVYKKAKTKKERDGLFTYDDPF